MVWFSLYSEISAIGMCFVTVITQRVSPALLSLLVALGFLPFQWNWLSVWRRWLLHVWYRTEFVFPKCEDASDGMVFFRISAQLPVWKMSLLGLVRSSGQMWTLHQDLVFLNVCSAHFEVRSLEFMTSGKGSSNGPTDEKKHSCLPLRSVVPPLQSSFDDWPVIIMRSCMVNVYFPLLRDFK